MKTNTTRSRNIAPAVLALVTGLTGCAAPSTPNSWKVEPNLRVAHSGVSVDRGYVALARRYEGERRWREARDAWRNAAVAAPNDVEILNAFAMAEAGMGRYAQSVAILRHAVALAPWSAQLMNNLGYALQLNGQHDEAGTVLRNALAVDPNHHLAKVNLDRVAAEPAVAAATPAAPAPVAVAAKVAAQPAPVASPTIAPQIAPDVPQQVPAPAAALQRGLQTEPNAQPLQLATTPVAGNPVGPAQTAPPMSPVPITQPALVVSFEPSLRTAPISSSTPPSVPATQPVTQPALVVTFDPPTRTAPIAAAPPAPAPAAQPATVAFDPPVRTVPIAAAPPTPAPVASVPPAAPIAPAAPAPRPALIVRAELAPPPTPARSDAPPPPAPIRAPAAIRATLPPNASLAQVHARVEIANGNGVNGMAAWIRGWLRSRGMDTATRLTNARPFKNPITTVFYRPGYGDAARAVAQQLPGETALAGNLGRSGSVDVRVVLGHDITTILACGEKCPTFRENTVLASAVLPALR